MIEPAVAQEPISQVSADTRELSTSVYFVTILGLLLAFPSVIPGLATLHSFGMSAGLSAASASVMVSVTASASRILLLFGVVLFIERRPLASLGLVRLSLSDLGLGLALFAGAAIVNGIYMLIVYVIFPHSMARVAPEQFKWMATLPIPAALALAVAAGFGEEIAQRGFALDRLRAATGSVGFAIVAVLVLSMAAHIAFWGWRYAILVGPTELILILVYLWRGSLWPNMIAHSLYDSLPVLSRIAVLAALSLVGTRSYHALQGDFRYRYGDYPAAIEEYTRALASAPGDPHLLGSRAGAKLMDHDYAGAIADLDIAIRKDAGNADYLIQRARAYFYARFYQQAEVEADKAIAAAPGRASLYEQRAEIEKWLAQPDKSIADLDQAIKLSKSKNAGLYSKRGQAYLAKRDYDKALQDLKLAGELRPDDTDTLLAIASAYGGKKEYGQGVATLTHLLAIEPGNEEAYIARAILHSWLGQHKAALADYRAAAKNAPDNAEAVNDLSWFLSTCPDAKLRDGKQALELASEACELSDWSQAQYIDTLAAAYAEQGNFDDAVVWEERAIDLASKWPTEIKQELQKHIDQYRKQLPYREEHPSG